jgi:transcription-repair coupling factor (superfamily II helicase)
MAEGELEEVIMAFFNHEFDVLVCTTIIESGVDIPRANTMIVDRADTFGLSQLYQLRGRIGRSKERAYCYLLVPSHRHLDPVAQERLKVLQENSSLGSGFRIAQHDLELRGAGNILGEEQSGHINAVGYELYLELLQEVLHELRGAPVENKEVEPEMNLKIPALIPDSYVPDIRSRLGIYRQLSNISGLNDIDQIETDLRDQYGAPPEPVLNLFGVMVIRRLCKDLGVRDISSGLKSLSLAFTDKTSVNPVTMVGLATREKAKYSLTPDSRLIIKMTDLGWQSIYEELVLLKKKVLP